MKFTVTKEKLLESLQQVQNVVSTRTTLPILSNVLLRAEGGRLEFTATDLDVTIACGVEAKVKKPGAATVPVIPIISPMCLRVASRVFAPLAGWAIGL